MAARAKSPTRLTSGLLWQAMSRFVWCGIVTVVASLLIMIPQCDGADSAKPSEKEQSSIEVFQNTLNQNALVLVEFTHRDDSAAKKLSLQSQAAAERLDMFLVFLRVDCADEKVLATKYNITTYPTIMLFSHGQSLKYDGAMTAEDIVMFGVSAYQQVRVMLVQKQEAETAAGATATSELRHVKTTVEALRFIDVNDIAVIGFFDEKDLEVQGGFKTFAAKSSGMAHALVTSEVVREGFKVKEVPKVVMFKTMGEKPVTFKGNCSDPNKLAAWASLNGNIPVRHLDAQKISDVSTSKIPVVLYFHGNVTNGVKGKEMLRELADEFTDVLVFYMADYESFGGLAQQFGLRTKDDSVIILYPPKGHHFVMPQKAELSSDTMRDFFNDYLADRVQRTLRSQAPPTDPWERGKVQTAVTTTLMDIIRDDKQDVLLELCKPTMQDCAVLGGIMDATAKAVGHVKTFKVVRVDVDANENKTGISYNGAATEAKILEHASKHASTPFEVPTRLREIEQKEAVEQKKEPTPEEVAKVETQAAEQVAALLRDSKREL